MIFMEPMKGIEPLTFSQMVFLTNGILAQVRVLLLVQVSSSRIAWAKASAADRCQPGIVCP